jgi:hypothetical protein
LDEDASPVIENEPSVADRLYAVPPPLDAVKAAATSVVVETEPYESAWPVIALPELEKAATDSTKPGNKVESVRSAVAPVQLAVALAEA